MTWAPDPLLRLEKIARLCSAPVQHQTLPHLSAFDQLKHAHARPTAAFWPNPQLSFFQLLSKKMVEEDGTPPATLRSSMGQSKGFQIASTAGTYADAEHVQTAEDAVDEAEKVFNQKHHTSKAFTGEDVSKGALATCLNSSRFESILSFVICLNMILIIAETDLTADGQEPPGWITSANLSFLAVYFVECVLKIWVFRWSYFQDTWTDIWLTSS